MDKLLPLLLALLVLIAGVDAYGMASSYLQDKTMYLYPGEEAEYKVELQNSDESEMNFKLVVESEIAEIKDKQEYYTVGNSVNVMPVIISIKMPSDARIGDEYKISYSAVPGESTGNTIGLNFRFNNEIKAVAVPKEMKETGNIDLEEINKPAIEMKAIAAISGIIMLIVIVILVLYRKNKNVFNRYGKW